MTIKVDGKISIIEVDGKAPVITVSKQTEI